MPSQQIYQKLRSSRDSPYGLKNNYITIRTTSGSQPLSDTDRVTQGHKEGRYGD
jgi:hypothetical protein